ncbi:MAG: oligosaccharide flippase family protein [Ardenticatenaceae bacterium]
MAGTPGGDEPVPTQNDPAEPGVAARAVSGSVYSVGSSFITWTLGSIRLLLLTRLLMPADVGVSAQALLFLSLALILQEMGLNNALIHHKEVNERVLSTYFTMRMLLLAVTLLLLAALAPLLGRFYPTMPLLTPVLLSYTVAEVVRGMNGVQTTILTKNLAFRRLAVADVASSLTMTVVAPYLAWQGWGVWALVAEHVSGILARAVVILGFTRAWRPRFGWDTAAAKWFLGFGKSVWTSTNLTYLITHFDDFWVGRVLGQSSLGLYARAYEFARYPRRVVANPILSVFLPTFARLQEDRLRLSRAYFRATSLMVRVGFWFSLVFVLGARDLIELVGPQWLPMVPVFQLMIVYTLFDPLAVGATDLLTATGHPHLVTRARLAQTLLFLPAVVLLGARWGIIGVALAADVMILIGAIILFAYTRRIVSYSSLTLWLWPSVALLLTGLAVFGLSSFWEQMPPLAALLGKAFFISVLYVGLLWLTEREQLRIGWQMIWGLLRPRVGPLLPGVR